MARITRPKKNILTADSFSNVVAKLGIQGSNDNLISQSRYNLGPFISRNRIELEAMYRSSWLIGQAVDVIAEDMTREGLSMYSEMKPEDVTKLQVSMNEFGVWKALCSTIKWARLYGGAVAVLLLDGADYSKPLDIEKVGKKRFKGLAVLDRWMIQPAMGDLITDICKDMGKPKFYEVMSGVSTFPSQKIHYSRVMRFDGIELPYYQSLFENLWGLSVVERMLDRLIAFDSATQGAAQLLYRAYLRVIGIEGLRDALASGGQEEAGVIKQFQYIRLLQSNEGITCLDSKDTFNTHAYSFAGMSDMIIQFGQQISGATGIPLVRLFGQSPAGLSSTGESDLRNYYDRINKDQENQLKPQLDKLFAVMSMSELGYALPEDFMFEFNPLWQMTENEKSQASSTDVNSISSAFNGGLIKKSTALKELKQLSTITGRFTNITGEDIKEAENEPPPGMDPFGAGFPEMGGEIPPGNESTGSTPDDPASPEDPNDRLGGQEEDLEEMPGAKDTGTPSKKIIRDVDFNESDHPRGSKGTEKGGQFVKKEESSPAKTGKGIAGLSEYLSGTKGKVDTKKVEGIIEKGLTDRLSGIDGHSVEVEFTHDENGYELKTYHRLEGKKGFAAMTSAEISPDKVLHLSAYEMNKPEMKGKGLASIMAQAAIDIAGKIGSKKAVLHALQDGRYFWGNKFGFKIAADERDDTLSKIRQFAKGKGIEIHDEKDFIKLKEYFDKNDRGLPKGFAMEKDIGGNHTKDESPVSQNVTMKRFFSVLKKHFGKPEPPAEVVPIIADPLPSKNQSISTMAAYKGYNFKQDFDGDFYIYSPGGAQVAKVQKYEQVVSFIERVAIMPQSEQVSVADEFSEEDHPRAEKGMEGGGQFVKKGEGGKAKEMIPLNREDMPSHIKGLKIPPAWTDVMYNSNPDGDILVIGTDSKGRKQYVYSDHHWAAAAQVKFERIKEMFDKFDDIQKENARHSSEEAFVLRCIMVTGIRPGSDNDTKAKVRAYGATTLEARHVVEKGENVELHFVGKKGVELHIPVTDKKIAKELIARKKDKKPDDRLFGIDAQKLLSYSHSLDGGNFKTKDFRTYVGTKTAMEKVKEIDPPKTEKEYKKKVREVAQIVSKVLGNTPTVALQSYISPVVFAEWRAKV